MSAQNDEQIYWNEEGGQRWVENIDRLESMLSHLSAKLMTSAAPCLGERVLDIGCGGGVTSSASAVAVGASGSVLGADISEVILEVAVKRYAALANLKFTAADAGTHAFEPATFDLMISRFGVMFFPDPEAAFANIYRAAKPGGRLVFICWRSLQENPWMGTPVAAAFSVLTPPEKGDPHAPGPFSLADRERTKRILSTAGFDDVTISPIDESVNLGDLELAVDFLARMGPAAGAIRAAEPAQRDAAIAAMRNALAPHNSDAGVIMPGAVWLVEARIN